QIGGARGLGVEACATGRTRIDIDGEHMHSVGGSEQRMNARACTKVEGGAKRPPCGTARKTAAIGADRHDVIVRNRCVPRMRKFGPGVIRKDQAITDGKQRRASPGQAHLIDCEQPGSDKHIALGPSEQSVEFVRRKSPLQQKQIDRQRERIATGQTLQAVYRHGTPLEVAKILQTETLSYETLGVSDISELGNGVAQFGHVGMVNDVSSRLGHSLKYIAI